MTSPNPTPNPWPLCDPADRATGYDTSHWQPDVPWVTAASLGVRWAIAKAFHGEHAVGSCPNQIQGARHAGMLTGRYCWWLCDVDVGRQIDAWCETPLDDGELPLSIDVEDTTTKRKGIGIKQDLEKLVLGIRLRTGRYPIFYTGLWWWNQYLGASNDSEVVAECPLWLAAYPRKMATGTRYYEAVAEVCAGTAPGLPFPWASRGIAPVAWQLDGDRGLLLPNGADVDVNVASWSALTALVPSHAPTDPAPPPGPVTTPAVGPATPIGWAERSDADPDPDDPRR